MMDSYKYGQQFNIFFVLEACNTFSIKDIYIVNNFGINITDKK